MTPIQLTDLRRVVHDPNDGRRRNDKILDALAEAARTNPQ